MLRAGLVMITGEIPTRNFQKNLRNTTGAETLQETREERANGIELYTVTIKTVENQGILQVIHAASSL